MLSALVKEASVPTTVGHGTAIRQHIWEVPAPVVTDALGYHHVTTTKSTTQAGKPGSVCPW